MKKGYTFAAMLVLAMFVLTGCFTPPVLNESRDIVALRKAIQQNDEVAIKAIKGGDGKLAGAKVTAWESIKEQPVKLGGAALIDTLLLYGGYEGVRYLTDDDSDSKKEPVGSGPGTTVSNNSGDTTVVNVNGDGNDVNVNKPLSEGGLVPQQGLEPVQ